MNDPATIIKSLGTQLPIEMARVRDTVLPEYVKIGIPGTFAVMQMRLDLDNATKAIMSGDVVGMLQAYEALKEWHV